MSSKQLIVIILLVLLIFPASVLADKPPRPDERRDEPPINLVEVLNLSDQKIENIKLQMYKHRLSHDRIQHNLSDAKDKLQDALLQENIDNQKVEEYKNKITELHKQLLDNDIDDSLQLRKDLTPEQLAKVRKFKHEHNKMRKPPEPKN